MNILIFVDKTIGEYGEGEEGVKKYLKEQLFDGHSRYMGQAGEFAGIQINLSYPNPCYLNFK